MIDKYFTIIGWEAGDLQKEKLRGIVSKFFQKLSKGFTQPDNTINEIGKILPEVASRIKKLPDHCIIQGIYFVYRGASTTSLSGIEGCLSFLGYLHRLRERFPVFVPNPVDLTSSANYAEAVIALMLFEGYDRKVKQEIASVTKKPFYFPHNGAGVRFAFSGRNYEVYLAAGKKVSVFTTTNVHKAFKVYVLYLLYALYNSYRDFLFGTGSLEKELKDARARLFKHIPEAELANKESLIS